MIKTILKQRLFKEILTSSNAFLYEQSPVKSVKSESLYQNRRKEIHWPEDQSLFFGIYPQIKNEILNDQLIYHPKLHNARKRYSELLDYMSFNKSAFYGCALTTIRSYKYFEKPSNLTEENLKKASILGWCLWLSESAMLVSDDILDNADMRFNKPAWYKLVGKNEAMMDVLFLETSVYYLLLRHFTSHPQYNNIQRELVRNISTLFISLVLEAKRYKLEEFEANENFVKAFPVVLTPVLCAMYLANITDDRLLSPAKQLCDEISRFVKIEDDVAHLFYPISETGKVCADEPEGRITWLAVQVAKYGSPSQKKMFVENYGKRDDEAVAKVKRIYEEMHLKEAFLQYQKDFYTCICQKIEELPKALPKPLFFDILDYALIKKYRA